ncbi:MAG: Ryanodine receptor Ryr [Bacteroidaceae bacterium]|nr:Ryanodine receptor Ryr [Bacteroidaceae bacterium]
MSNNKYNPKPIDTSAIKLPQDLLDLGEQIAKNVHDVWAAGRIKDGWTYGPVRDDANKHHPCLVPYEELPEEEKAYDRNTAQETLRLIMKLGFNISK